MKFSIVTPVRNGMPALTACVESVRRQSHREHEHIVQDGGSADGSAEWLARQPDLDWRSEPDRGMYDALNRGFKRAGGDVLGWLNADEQYLDNALDTVRRFLDEHPRADAVFGDYIAIAADGAPIAARREIPLRRWYAVNGTLYVQSCALFFRRRVLDRTGEFDPSFRIAGDKEWILRALDRGARFAHLRAYLALFSVSGSNLSRQPALRAESERVRRLHRALRVPALRLVPRLCRWAEKAARGCLGRRRVSYRFIHPGTLSVRPVSARVGSAWRWSASP